ncbi:hypothetical protein J6V86_03360 [bacterium]|nr:hypothetical protein [bacterium]
MLDITVPSSSSNQTDLTNEASAYPYFSRTTLVNVTSSDVLKVRVSRSDTAQSASGSHACTTTFLSSAALDLTAKSPALTTPSVSSLAASLHLAGHASVSVVHAITVIGSSQSTTASFPSDLISINITYPLTSFVDSALAI